MDGTYGRTEVLPIFIFFQPQIYRLNLLNVCLGLRSLKMFCTLVVRSMKLTGNRCIYVLDIRQECLEGTGLFGLQVDLVFNSAISSAG